jgi:hypothetical protein
LNGEIDDISQVDSLHMIKEIFGNIRNEYKKTAGQIEATKREMEENPEKFKKLLEQQKSADPTPAVTPTPAGKPGDKGTASKKPEEVKKEEEKKGVEEESLIQEEEKGSEEKKQKRPF